jgi:hypothetical protein
MWSRDRLSATNSAIEMENVASRTALCDKFRSNRVENNAEKRSRRQVIPLKKKCPRTTLKDN